MKYKEEIVQNALKENPFLLQRGSFLDAFQTSNEIQLLNVVVSISRLEKLAVSEPKKALNRLMNLELHPALIWRHAATESLERLTSRSMRCC